MQFAETTTTSTWPTYPLISSGEGRFLTYLSASVFPNPEEWSDNRGNSGSIEGGDVYGHSDGTTTSKFYNGRRMLDHIYHGVTGSSNSIPVGAWQFMGNREHSSGGPFFKDIDFQTGSSVELYNYTYSGHTQTEPYRIGDLHGPYALQFTDGSLPTAPNYGWMESLNLQGWISAPSRGMLTGVASGIPNGTRITVGLSNATAQYWGNPNANGSFTISDIQPGTHTQTLYRDELQVGEKTIVITAGKTTNSNITSTAYFPTNPIFRIGTWDGTPLGFLNTEPTSPNGPAKIEVMHPSDIRMTSWTSTPNFIIGTNTDAQWPLAQWKDVNNSQRITFNLSAAQVQNLTLRIGITLGFEGGRNQITVNSGKSYVWSSANPTASSDLNSRSITRGTWRGRNRLYTFSIPSTALRTGANTIDLPVISGNSGSGYLSPAVVYDAIELLPSTSAVAPVIASVTITPTDPISVNGVRSFTAVARDAGGNILNANISWAASRGTIDGNGNYVGPGTSGNDTITATAVINYGCYGYATTSSSTSSVAGTITGSGIATLSVIPAVDPPTAVGTFSAESAPNNLSFVFNESVTINDPLANILISRQGGGAISPGAYSYDSNTRTASFDLPTPLTDGIYDAVFVSGSVRDLSGNPLADGFLYTFSFLNADANGDRAVDTQDFNILAANFGAAAATFSHGNFNYDQVVDSADFAILVAQYGKRLILANAPSPTPSVLPSTPSSPPFTWQWTLSREWNEMGASAATLLH